MGKRRQAWEGVYDGIRIVRGSNYVCVPPATDAELDKLESQIGSRLPHSYREFMKRFGPGELQGWVRLTPVTPGRERNPWTVAGRTAELWDLYTKEWDWYSNHQWLSSVVYFASSGGGDEYAWDPAAVTCSRPHECRFYYLRRLGEEHPVEAGDSFWKFVEWVEAVVRSWSDRAQSAEAEPGISFSPDYLRDKKRPRRRDVTAWLAWNDGAILGLAKAIRDQGKSDTFPILGDALEEAGCTNADMLDSCRKGDPAIDGVWVLQVLLGKQCRERGRR
jgi:hypothetical protein